MKHRSATFKRKTSETSIQVHINLDGRGQYQISTGLAFLDHMLAQLCRHALFDITISATGDLDVDGHHTIEDVAIALGSAFEQALGQKTGISRFGDATVPMEDALASVAVDLSGRPFLAYNVQYKGEKIGQQFDVELVEEFMRAFANSSKMNLHINVPYGANNHHIAEAIFKALARSLRSAVSIDPREQQVPSTKGVL